MTNLLLNCDFCKKRYSAIYKDFRNLSNSSPVQSFPNKRLWSLDFALEIVLRPLPRRTAILEPKSVIRPFNVIFYNCLQSFAFYKVSFACF